MIDPHNRVLSIIKNKSYQATKTRRKKGAVQDHNEGDFLGELRRKKRREQDWLRERRNSGETELGRPGFVVKSSPGKVWYSLPLLPFSSQRKLSHSGTLVVVGHGGGGWRPQLGLLSSTLGLLSFAYLWITGYSHR